MPIAPLAVHTGATSQSCGTGSWSAGRALAARSEAEPPVEPVVVRVAKAAKAAACPHAELESHRRGALAVLAFSLREGGRARWREVACRTRLSPSL